MSHQKPSYERYQRQIILSGVGEEGQQKLFRASVLIIGAGGLGCPALQYLVAAGVGKIGIVDNDTVSLHNLHRQVLYTTADIGRLKAEVAATRLAQMNPDVELITYPFSLTNQNALDIIGHYDYVLDATDNFATRYMVNDACVLLNKPLIYGAISQFEGQVAVFNKGENAVNYRDLFPEPPKPGSVLNCAEAGVLGVLPGIIGTMQATEVLKLVTGIGKPVINQLFTYNALTNESFIFNLSAKKETTASLLPASAEAFQQLDYDWLCGTGAAATEEMDVFTFNQHLQKKGIVIIDVREKGEQPAVTEFAHQQIPLSSFNENFSPIKEDTVIIFCQSGKRSKEAASRLTVIFGETKKIYSLQGGILNWKNHGKEKA